MPALYSRIWHFPKSSTETLKADASQENVGSFVSTYDAMMALLWKSITRAKMPLLNPSLDQKVVLVHALNTRTRLDPLLPDRYLGNAVALPRVEPVTIRSVLDDGNLPRVAATVRASIKAVTPDYVARLAEWAAGLEDRRWIMIKMDSFLGMDLAGTSWQSMSAYTKHDFGLGLPSALRWPGPAFEGYVFVFPSRAGVVGWWR